MGTISSCGGVTAGISNTNRLPLPDSLSTRICPLCSRQIFWLTLNPNPVPRPPLLETKIVNMFSISSGGIPLPLSNFVAGVQCVGDNIQHRAVHALGVKKEFRHLLCGLPAEPDIHFLSARLHQLNNICDHIV